VLHVLFAQVGLACCQIAQHLGAVVTGTAGTEDGMQAAWQNGATTVVNHRDPGYTDEIKVPQNCPLNCITSPVGIPIPGSRPIFLNPESRDWRCFNPGISGL